MLSCLFASLAMGTNVATHITAGNVKRDAEIIVEVDRELETLSEAGIVNTQNIVMNNIRSYVTSNFRVISRYDEVANAFAISVNSADIELIKKVPGVKSVTLNEMHWVQEQSTGTRGTPIENEYGDNDNVSARTMEKGNDTNDGEGTVIAILDNEFYLKGATSESSAWAHEVFSPLGSSVVKRFEGHPTNWNSTTAYNNAKSRGELLTSDADLGKEGSLYYNDKVPFYYDYGGEKTLYADDIRDDLDVTSEVSYHGSHVASIAAANAPTYKGIAPKAQLVLMKVFTNYKPSDVAKQVGWGNSSGAYDIPIMNALNDCMKLKVDGINMSLGSNLDDFDKDSITNRTLNKLAKSGILTSISAGNSGKTSYATTGGYANWTSQMVETGILSGYANDPQAMTIASGQPDKIFYSAAFKMGDDIIPYDDQIVNREYLGDEYEKEFKMEDLVDESHPTLGWVYVPGFGTGADYAGLDVNGKIAVVSRGSTSFADKYATAKSKGAIALVVINNDPTSNDFNFHMSFGDGFRPTMPCALVLYRDLELFSSNREGNINIIKKEMVENEKARTISTFSSDGATYLLDLKPEITAPGDLIRGAIPPQESEDKTEERRTRIYEYLSGTSMSAPNYAGAQSVILSKKAKAISEEYAAAVAQAKAEAIAAGKTEAEIQKAMNNVQISSELSEYRQTVDMRLMSTATPMNDLKENPETGVISLTSPRKQGAGMANIGDAYRTDVYLEGYDATGKNGIKKAKIELRNGEKVNNGTLDLKFMAHNEGESDRNYNIKLTVMRPAIAKANDVVTKDYNFRGEVDDIRSFPGHAYWLPPVIEGNDPTRYETAGEYNDKDVFTVTRDIKYFATSEAAAIGTEEAKDGFIAKGNYYYDAQAGMWKSLPTKDYQSVYDVVIAEVNLGSVTAQAGKTTKVSQEYTISNEAKAEIAAFYTDGCYLEGYVTLESNDETAYPSLSMPFMGFYGGGDKDYGDAPVVEPFAFDKNISTVYPSDLTNDIAKSLLGKDKADMGSMWVVGYVKDGEGVNVDDVLANDTNFAELSGFHNIGTDPNTDGEYYDDVRNNLYVGNSYSTNTMIIQQFVLRSVKDNYFTITNKKTGKTVYKSALEDMLFGSRFGVYPLYKSHVDDSYLGAGYVSHRAYAIVPLYDRTTGQPFASGDYEVTFNYLLASTSEWVSSSYNLKIDSEAPEVSSITTNGDNVRINIKEANLSSITVDKKLRNLAEVVKVDDNNSYIELSKSEVEDILFNQNFNHAQGSGRLYINLVDKAYGEMGVIVRFDYNEDDDVLWNKYTMVEHHSLMRANDFRDDGKNITIVRYNSTTRTETEVNNLEGDVIVSRGPIKYTTSVTKQGCGGNIYTSSVVLSTLALTITIGLVISVKARKRKMLGGND